MKWDVKILTIFVKFIIIIIINSVCVCVCRHWPRSYVWCYGLLTRKQRPSWREMRHTHRLDCSYNESDIGTWSSVKDDHWNILRLAYCAKS